METSRLCTASRRATSARNEDVGVLHQPDDVRCHGRRAPRVTRSRFFSRVLICSFARGDVASTGPGHPSRRRGTPRECCGSGRRACVSDVGEPWSVSISLGGLRQALERIDHVVRQDGALDRDLRSPRRGWPGPAGSSESTSRPAASSPWIAARVSGPKPESVSTLKVTLTWPPLEDRADSTLPTRTPAMRTSSSAFEAAGLRERGVVGVAAADQRQVLGAERRPASRRDDGEAQRP